MGDIYLYILSMFNIEDWKEKSRWYSLNYTTGKPLSNRPKPTSAITGTIPRGLKNLKCKINVNIWYLK